MRRASGTSVKPHGDGPLAPGTLRPCPELIANDAIRFSLSSPRTRVEAFGQRDALRPSTTCQQHRDLAPILVEQLQLVVPLVVDCDALVINVTDESEVHHDKRER